MKILGFESKKFTWKVVENSIKKLSPAELKKIDKIVAVQSSYHEDECYAVIFLTNGEYVNLPLIQRKCQIEAGMKLDPKSLMVYALEGPYKKRIQRVYAKPL